MKILSRNKFILPVIGLLALLCSSDAIACVGPTSGEKVVAFALYFISVGLAFYSVFSRLTHSPKKVFIPICIAVLIGYFGVGGFGCSESTVVARAVAVLVGCIVLSCMETYYRRKAVRVNTNDLRLKN